MRRRYTRGRIAPEDRVAEIAFDLTEDTDLSSTDLLSLLRLIDYMAHELLVEESQILLETLEIEEARSVDTLSRMNDVARTVPAPLTISRIERGSWQVVTHLDATSIVRFLQHTLPQIFATIWQSPDMQNRVAEFLAERAFSGLRRRIRQIFGRKGRAGTVKAESVEEETSTPERPAIRVVLRRTEVLEVSADDEAAIARIMRDYRRRHR